ncbi:hypothetical protein MK851_11785 [Tenacibaculum sp. 1B UA]|uniref:hypothetical protein n=1 Tax=Tenacibaculum sp. 1B UA TaxID=2922252 RepID=UPI002A2495F2|nr:hypothetical protein [Tenacibaculum sp. 1B UA]MDX8554301.1 hypothetical protein [Tenacibaculum sp. 1B UA]
MKKLEEFKNQEIDVKNIFGSFDGIVATGGGELGGLKYTSDLLRDDNRDGKFGPGEHLTLNWDRTGGGGMG